jgi:hypothetical protein
MTSPPGVELRIRAGVERDGDGRWRPIVHLFGPIRGEVREYTGQWFTGPTAEREADARANDLAIAIRAEIASHPRVKVLR